MRVIPPAVAICLLLAGSPLNTAAVAEPLVVKLEGTLTRADKGTYQEQVFEVPPGVGRLDFEFTHSHKAEGTQLEVGLFDPSGFRGTSRFSKSRFHVAEGHATPSYVPGRIPAGRWRVSIGIPAIGTAGATWQVTIRMTRIGDASAGLSAALGPGPAWFAGDFHSHTLHSDVFECHEPGQSLATHGLSAVGGCGGSPRRGPRLPGDHRPQHHQSPRRPGHLAGRTDQPPAAARIGTDHLSRPCQRLRHQRGDRLPARLQGAEYR